MLIFNNIMKAKLNAPLLIKGFPMGPRGWQDALWFGFNEWVKWMNETYQVSEWWTEWMRNWTTQWMNVWKSKWMTDEVRSKNSHVQMRFFCFVVCVVVQVRSFALCICWCNVCVHWAIEDAGRLARERDREREQRRKCNNSVKRKAPVASFAIWGRWRFLLHPAICRCCSCSSSSVT